MVVKGLEYEGFVISSKGGGSSTELKPLFWFKEIP